VKTARNPIEPSLFVRVRLNGGDFGPGKADLLDAVARTGSISEAARSMAMSYRRAWMLLDSASKLLGGRRLIVAATGGTKGGGARLTPFGREVVATYRDMTARIDSAARSSLRRFQRWTAAEP
jgi:molybdate transport system regulatory protein